MDDKPKFGRRAAAENNDEGDEPPRAVVKGWDDHGSLQQPNTAPEGDDLVGDLPTLESGVDEAQLAPREEEDMSREVAAAPAEYHSQMPTLGDLDGANKWASLVARAEGGVDLTCLTDVLCNQLDDEDVAWNPDLLLVQLTSELVDDREEEEETAAAAPSSTLAPEQVPAASGPGEGTRRRRGDKK